MIQRNYQKELENTIKGLETVPTLLLHSCCAPCSSYVLEYLSDFFEITVYYYNPNIAPEEEYDFRLREVKRLIDSMHFQHPVHLIEGKYEPERFFEAAEGLEEVPEGGARCEKCFRLRLSEAAKIAQAGGFDYFTTTLTISPLKNAELLNTIGEEYGKEYDVSFLPSDFKKRGGYQRSIELSKEYDLYRQNFCGCVFSMREAEERKAKKELS